jgi:DNA-binding NarL/FixJ family response regulator
MKTKASQKPKIRVGIFDDDPLRVIGFRVLLDAERDLELKNTGDSEHSDGIEIDVAVLRGRRGFSLAAHVEKVIDAMPGIRVLVTGFDLNEGDIADAIGRGAKGYISETASAAEFASAIRIVNQGLIWAPRRLLSVVIGRIGDTYPSAALHRTGTHHQPRTRSIANVGGWKFQQRNCCSPRNRGTDRQISYLPPHAKARSEESDRSFGPGNQAIISIQLVLVSV